MNQQERETLHLAMIEDFSNVIAKHLPNFDNNSNDICAYHDNFSDYNNFMSNM